jgi:hypothetical protein
LMRKQQNVKVENNSAKVIRASFLEENYHSLLENNGVSPLTQRILWKRLKNLRKGTITFTQLQNIKPCFFSAIEILSLETEDIRISNEEFNKLIIADFSVVFFSALSVGFSTIQCELDYFYGTDLDV